MHLNHFKKEYKNFTEALTHKDGLLVWGNLFELDHHSRHNYNLEMMIKYLPNVLFAGIIC